MNNKISLRDIAAVLARRHGLSVDEAEAFMAAAFEVINDGLRLEGSVKVKGLGTFKIVDVKERESVSVQTGERVVIESHGKITFTPDAVLRDLVNKPFAQFETVVLNDGVDLEHMAAVPEEQPEPTETAEPTETTEEQPAVDKPIETTEPVIETTEPIIETTEPAVEPTAEPVIETPEPAIEPIEPAIEPTEPTAPAVEIEEPQEQEEPAAPAAEVIAPVEESVAPIAEEPIAEEPIAEAPEKEAPKEEEDYSYLYEDEEPWCKRHRALCHTLFIIVLAIVFGGGGYYYGRYMQAADMAQQGSEPAAAESKADCTAVAKTDTVAADSLSATAAQTTNKATADDKAAADNKAAAEKTSSATSPQSSDSYDQLPAELETAVRVVRTGAYRIVGTDQTITARPGDTMRRLAKHYFGDGMEAYIQVHNGTLEVTAGMEVKIPKLENKKRRTP